MMARLCQVKVVGALAPGASMAEDSSLQLLLSLPRL